MSHPEVFYKYVTADVASIVLSSGRLRWSSPFLFDDPAEFRRMPRFEPSVKASYPAFLDMLIAAASGPATIPTGRLSPSAATLFGLFKLALRSGAAPEELRPNAEDLANADDHIAEELNNWVSSLGVDTSRILCVTTNSNSAPMWDRYAGRHTGAVLGFRHIADLSTPLLAAEQVQYSAEPAVAGTGLDFLLYGDTPELRRRTYAGIFLSKMASWSYQEEWRAITWCDHEEGLFGDYPFHPDELESITCGLNASVDCKARVRDLATRFPRCRVHFISAGA